MWRSRRGCSRRQPARVRVAYLYRVELARPKRPATPAQLAALARAGAARRTCPTCGQLREYTIPRSLGQCVDCADTWRQRAGLGVPAA